MKVTQFTKPMLDRFNNSVLKELEEFAAARGLKISVAGCTYSRVGDENTVKIKFTTSSDTVSAQRATKEDEKWFELFGLPKDSVGRHFTDRGYAFTITGIAPNRRRYPIQVTRADGHKFKYSAESIKNLLP